MRKAMQGANPDASSGVANGNSSSAGDNAMGVAPMDVMADNVPEEDGDEDDTMADAEQKVGCTSDLFCKMTYCRLSCTEHPMLFACRIL